MYKTGYDYFFMDIYITTFAINSSHLLSPHEILRHDSLFFTMRPFVYFTLDNSWYKKKILSVFSTDILFQKFADIFAADGNITANSESMPLSGLIYCGA